MLNIRILTEQKLRTTMIRNNLIAQQLYLIN
jgi:hypothetical protein